MADRDITVGLRLQARDEGYSATVKAASAAQDSLGAASARAAQGYRQAGDMAKAAGSSLTANTAAATRSAQEIVKAGEANDRLAKDLLQVDASALRAASAIDSGLVDAARDAQGALTQMGQGAITVTASIERLSQTSAQLTDTLARLRSADQLLSATRASAPVERTNLDHRALIATLDAEIATLNQQQIELRQGRQALLDYQRAEALATSTSTQFRAQVNKKFDELKRLHGELDRGRESIDNNARGYDLLRNAALGYISVQGALQIGKALIDDADQYALLTGRLKLATSGAEDLAAAQQGLIDIARQTNSQLAPNVDLYTRLERGYRSLKVPQSELLTITKAVNDVLKIQNVDAGQTAAVLLQLGQAIEQNALRSEEFTSVNENASLILDAVAKRLGVNRGELKKLASEGAITAQVLRESLIEAAPEFAEQAAQIPLTVGAAFGNLRREIALYVGDADQASGATAELAAVIQYAADNVDQIVNGLRVVLELSLAIGVGRGLNSFLGLVVSTRAAILQQTLATTANTAANVANAASVRAATAATQSWTISMVSARAVGQSLLTVIGGWPGVIALATVAIFELARGLSQTQEEAEALNAQIFATERGRINFRIEGTLSEIKAANKEIAELQQQLKQPFLLPDQVKTVTDQVQGVLGRIDILQERLQKLKAQLAESKGELGEAPPDAISGAVEKITDSLDRNIEKLQEQIIELRNGAKAALEYERSQALLKATNDKERQAINDRFNSLVKLTAELNTLKKAEEDGKRATKENADALRDAAKALQELTDLQQDQAEALGGPLVDALNTYKDTLKQIADAEQDLLGFGPPTRESLELTARLRANAVVLLNRENDEITTRIKAGTDEIKVLQKEINLLQASGRERRLLAREYQTEEALLQIINARKAAGIPLTAQEIEQLRTMLELVTQLNDAAEFDFRAALGEAVEDGFNNASLGRFFKSFGDALGEAFENADLTGKLGIANQVAGFLSSGIDQIRAAETGVGKVVAGIGLLGGPFAEAAGIFDTVNKIFGGSLFGTSFKTNKTGFDVGLTEGGFFGSQFEEQKKKKSFFRGTKRRTITSDLDAGTLEQLDALFDAIIDAVTFGAEQLGVEVPSIIEGTFREVQDKNGKVIQQTATVLGKQYTESFEAFQERLQAENLIAVVAASASDISAAITETIRLGVSDLDLRNASTGLDVITQTSVQLVNEAQYIAERWRANAGDLLDGAKLLLAAQTDIVKGQSLLGGSGAGELSAVIELTEDLRIGSEDLSATYVRLAQSTSLLENAGKLLATEFDLNREEFVRFANDIALSAGGIGRAAELWSAFLSETFFDPEELLGRRADQARTDAARELGDVGLDTSVTAEEFRALFDDLLPTLSADAIVQWLEAAEALQGLIDVQAELTRLEEERAQRQREALNDAFYNDTFFSADELRQRQLAEQQAAAASALDAIGLDGSITAEEFRTLFEEQLPQLSGEALNQWIAAADALSALIALQEEANAVAEEQQRIEADRLEQEQAAAEAALEAQRQAEAAARERLDGLLVRVQSDIDQLTLDPFRQRLKALRQELNDSLAAAQAAGASEAELGQIHRRFALQVRALVADISQSIVELSQQFSGSLRNSVDSVGAAIGNVASSVEDLSGAADSLRAVADRLLTNPAVTPLAPRAQLEELQRQFDAALQGGDYTGASQLAEQLAQQIRFIFASSSEGDERILALRERLLGVADQISAANRPVTSAQVDNIGSTTRELADSAASQVQLAAQIVEQLAVLAELQPDLNAIDIANELNVPLQQILATLVGDLSDADTRTVQSIGLIAEKLQLGLGEITELLGINIGSVEDGDSLLGRAIRESIGSLEDLTDEQRQQLLDALEQGNVEELERLISGLDVSLRDQLAPFFDRIDISEPARETVSILENVLSAGRTGNDLMRNMVALMQRIGDNAAAYNTSLGIPAYEVGTPFVPRTGLALLHAGEAVIPAAENTLFRRALKDGFSGSNANTERILLDILAALTSGSNTAPVVGVLQQLLSLINAGQTSILDQLQSSYNQLQAMARSNKASLL